MVLLTKCHLKLCSLVTNAAHNNNQFNSIWDDGGISPQCRCYCTRRGYPAILSTVAALSRIMNSLHSVLFLGGTVSHCARHAVLEGRALPLWDFSQALPLIMYLSLKARPPRPCLIHRGRFKAKELNPEWAISPLLTPL